jgi:hypothetical protein
VAFQGLTALEAAIEPNFAGKMVVNLMAQPAVARLAG